MNLSAPVEGGQSELFASLAPRERSLVGALILVALLMLGGGLWYVRSDRLATIDRKIAKATEAAELARVGGADYAAKLADKQARESRLSRTPLVFSSEIERVSSQFETVTVTGEAEPPAVDLTPELRKRVVEFSLRSVTLRDTLEFLAAMEAKRGHVVLAEKLVMRSGGSEEDSLTVDVTVATWERLGADDEDEASDGLGASVMGGLGLGGAKAKGRAKGVDGARAASNAGQEPQ